ncbi:hypothetical protein ONZ45_g11262 [Pleurotus djamor]|nr:hypothetical protein ONZ45_g11262 [Pleurotus djamor]
MRVPHNFILYAEFRRSVRNLSISLPALYKAVEGITASQAHRRYVNAHLEHARRCLLHILKSVRSHRLSLSLTPLRSVWLKIFYHTSDGHDTLHKVSQISSDITRLLSGNALCTIERANALGALFDPPVTAPSRPSSFIAVNGRRLSTLEVLHEIEVSQVRPNDKIIILMGATGSGKTTFINTAVGRDIGEVSHSLRPCTRRPQAFRYQHEGRYVVFIDTPGLDESSVREAEVMTTLSSWLDDLHLRQISPSGLLYLHNMSMNRMSNYHSALLSKMCGTDAQNNVVIVPTMGQELGPADYQKRLSEVGNYWARAFGTPSVKTFDDTLASAWVILDSLNTACPLRVTLEMASSGTHIGNTSVGHFLLEWLGVMATKLKKAPYPDATFLQAGFKFICGRRSPQD